jgi:hypothetical protein
MTDPAAAIDDRSCSETFGTIGKRNRHFRSKHVV